MEKLKEKLITANIFNTELMKSFALQALSLFGGFIFGGISFAGGLSPFGTGFIAGVPFTYLISASVGAAGGYALFFGLLDSLRFIAAVFVICLLRLGLEQKAEGKTLLSAGLSALIISFVSSLGVSLALGESAIFIIMCLSESLISCAFACFTVRAVTVPEKLRTGLHINTADTLAAVFFAAAVLLGGDRFGIFGFSLSRITAFFAIMLFAVMKKGTASALAGICCALALGFNEDRPEAMTAYLISGLSSGLLSLHGKIPVAASIVLSSLLAVILRGQADTAMISISEAVISALLFAAVPKKTLMSLIKTVTPENSTAENNAAVFALKRSAKAVRDIASSVEAVTAFLGKSTDKTKEKLSLTVKEELCSTCPKYEFCWINNEALTKKAFAEAENKVRENERLLYDDIPERITLLCKSPARLGEAFSRAYSMHIAELLALNEINDAKKTAAKSFLCAGDLIEDAVKTLDSPDKRDTETEELLSPFFEKKGFSLHGLHAAVNSCGKKAFQLYAGNVPLISDMNTLLEEIYELTGTLYLPPVVDEYSKEGTVLSFTEEGEYSVEYHTASHTGAGEKYSGDTAKCFYDGTGYFYAVLSDGMGSGGRAAVDSVMTCILLSRLMRAGFSPEAALGTVNCALLLKSGEETLSTLDIMRFDINSGKAEFFKAGAAFSVIKKRDKTLIVEKSSMPLGILTDTLFEKSEIELSAGDTIMIISDGAAVIPPTMYKEILTVNKTAEPKRLAEAAVEKALALSPIGKHDDITVTCIRIRKS